MMRSGNPALNENTFAGLPGVAGQETMTIQGTVNKAAILLVCVIVTAGWIWDMFFTAVDTIGGVPNPGIIYPYLIGGTIAGLVLALATVFKKTWSPVTAPLYALAEGLLIGGLSAIMEQQFPGIVVQAVGLTFGVLFSLLFAYKTGLVKATENFKLGVAAATGGIFLVYMVSFVLGFFGTSIPYIHGSGVVGIGFSAFVVVIAALNLVLDFDFIEHGAERNAPKHMEWFAAFGLMVTLIWLYIEILHLLAKLRRN